MGVAESLAPSELAKQMAHPEGDVGVTVARWLDDNNRASDAGTVASLDLRAGSRVLEIGFGTGRIVAAMFSQIAQMHYMGIDTSPTMVVEAARANVAVVASGRANFQLGSAESIPFPASCFDTVFSIGVAHFWAEPVKPLSEVRRVLQPGGLSMMGCLHPKAAPGFARSEYGFHLRNADEWDAIHRAAGFDDIRIEEVESEQIGPDGAPAKRYVFKLAARA